MQHETSLQALQTALDDLREERINIAGLCLEWRRQTSLLAALPARYGEVMEDLLGRLEAGSLFTEESCSFSQEDLLTTLGVWLEKAKQTLTT